jgi:enoyl reductase-like protein
MLKLHNYGKEHYEKTKNMTHFAHEHKEVMSTPTITWTGKMVTDPICHSTNQGRFTYRMTTDKKEVDCADCLDVIKRLGI